MGNRESRCGGSSSQRRVLGLSPGRQCSPCQDIAGQVRRARLPVGWLVVGRRQIPRTLTRRPQRRAFWSNRTLIPSISLVPRSVSEAVKKSERLPVGRRKRLPHLDVQWFTSWWGRRFRLPTDFFTASHGRGSVTTVWPSIVLFSRRTEPAPSALYTAWPCVSRISFPVSTVPVTRCAI